MEIRLKPEHEAMVAEDVASGRYASADEYVSEAVELLHERHAYDSRLLRESIAQAERGELISEEEIRRDLDQRRARLEESWQQGERGELISLDEFREEIKVFKADWIKQQRSA
jgi:putative addiction module CopG family antidote